MDKIQFTQNIQSNLTVISNDFIDRYMLKADGEFVKIYLLLLRLTNQGNYTGPEQLADLLQLTLRDIRRALNYWMAQGLITPEDAKAEPEEFPVREYERKPDVPFTVKQAPPKAGMNPTELAASIKGTDLEQTLYMAEMYMGHPLSQSEICSLYYIDRQLDFDSDLLEYLVEYCVTRGKANIRYIESVAVNWYQHDIDTVRKAKAQSAAYTRNVFPVMKAFGISNRNPAPSELEYIRSWNDMGLDTGILVEACNRTMLQTHQASFPYANSILEKWNASGVRCLDDIKALDDNYHNRKSSVRPYEVPEKKKTANAFHNFEQRSYDYDDLEARLLDLKQS